MISSPVGFADKLSAYVNMPSLFCLLKKCQRPHSFPIIRFKVNYVIIVVSDYVLYFICVNYATCTPVCLINYINVI